MCSNQDRWTLSYIINIIITSTYSCAVYLYKQQKKKTKEKHTDKSTVDSIRFWLFIMCVRCVVCSHFCCSCMPRIRSFVLAAIENCKYLPIFFFLCKGGNKHIQLFIEYFFPILLCKTKFSIFHKYYFSISIVFLHT